MTWSIFSLPDVYICAIVDLLVAALLKHQFDKIDNVSFVVGLPDVAVVHFVVGQSDYPVAVGDTIKKGLIDWRVTDGVVLDKNVVNGNCDVFDRNWRLILTIWHFKVGWVWVKLSLVSDLPHVLELLDRSLFPIWANRLSEDRALEIADVPRIAKSVDIIRPGHIIVSRVDAFIFEGFFKGVLLSNCAWNAEVWISMAELAASLRIPVIAKLFGASARIAGAVIVNTCPEIRIAIFVELTAVISLLFLIKHSLVIVRVSRTRATIRAQLPSRLQELVCGNWAWW